MAKSYAGLANMAVRFGFRLAKAREGSQHLGMPVRYLLENGNGALPFRSLGDVERKLSMMAEERAKRRARSFKRTIQTVLSEPLARFIFSGTPGPTRAGQRASKRR